MSTPEYLNRFRSDPNKHIFSSNVRQLGKKIQCKVIFPQMPSYLATRQVQI